MIWFLLGTAATGLIAALAYAWQEWVAPWREVEAIVGKISRNERPSTFLVGGAPRPRAVARALEILFQRQAHLAQQMAERTSGSETIFGALQDGLLVVDTRRRLTVVNAAFRALIGSTEELVGEPLLEVIRDPALDRLIGDTLSTGEPQSVELNVAGLAHSSTRRMQLSAVPIKNNARPVSGVVVLFHDVTQLKQIDEIRRDFVANVSHELRTPLSILRGYIETLLEDPATPPEELVRILEVMNRHSQRLGALVEDLLTLAKLESAEPDLQLSELNLGDFFAALRRDWARKLTAKKLNMEISVPGDLPPVYVDETRLQEVLYNLLDNALKYSATGGKISLQAEKQNDEVIISVTDTGVGIPEADLPRVFERFYRADKARSRELGGTGLGLSIVKHIAQMHGGRVEAESQAGQGTTIRVILPLRGAGRPSVTES